MNEHHGTFYGLGVGPGDPDLITVKACKILQEVDVVYAAASTKNQHSLAVSIARPHIPEGKTVTKLFFPMTKDPVVMEQAWQAHARTIYETLQNGRHAAFLTLGDPMTYSTYGYILRHLKAMSPEPPIETIPGVTSYQAAAARLNTPLVEGEESLLITSGVNGGANFRKLEAKPENVVFLKAYRNAGDIVAAIHENNGTYHGVGITHCGHPQEEIISDISELAQRQPDYWTLILAKQRNGLGPK